MDQTMIELILKFLGGNKDWGSLVVLVLIVWLSFKNKKSKNRARKCLSKEDRDSEP